MLQFLFQWYNNEARRQIKGESEDPEPDEDEEQEIYNDNLEYHEQEDPRREPNQEYNKNEVQNGIYVV